jgi:hypothetical protein
MRFRRLFPSLWKFLFKFNKRVRFDDVVMRWTIIQRDLSMKEYEKRYVALNKYFKYMFLAPLVMFGHWLLRRCHIKIEDEAQNDLLKCHVAAWDTALREWCVIRCADLATASEYYENDSASKMLKKINDIMVAGYLHDGIYRIFFDLYMQNVAVELGKKYPGKFGGYAYTSKHIDDVDYRIITGRSDEHVQLNLGDGRIGIVKKGDMIIVKPFDKQEARKI